MTNNVIVKLKVQTTDSDKAIGLFCAFDVDSDFESCFAGKEYFVKSHRMAVSSAGQATKIQATYHISVNDFSLTTFGALEKLGFTVEARYYDERESFAGKYKAGRHTETVHRRARVH